MFLQVCVILFTGGGIPDQVPPGTRYTPRTRYTPPGTRYTPGIRYTPQTRYTPPGTRYTPLLGPGTPPGTRYTPPDQVHPPPPGPGTPRTRYTPRDQVHPPRDQGDTVYARAVRILLECILVYLYFLPFPLQSVSSKFGLLGAGRLLSTELVIIPFLHYLPLPLVQMVRQVQLRSTCKCSLGLCKKE